MSGGTLVLLIFVGLMILMGASFLYGFKLGVRAERTEWDLRRMFNFKEKPARKNPDKKHEPVSDLQVAINEQLGFWQNEPDSINTEFCEKYMTTLKYLRLHINRAKRDGTKKWQAMQPVWDEMDFERVTINTCLNYHLSREKLMDNLNKLLECAGGKPRLVKIAS